MPSVPDDVRENGALHPSRIEEELAPTGPTRLGVVLTLAALAGLALLIALVDPLREGFTSAIGGQTGALRSELRDLGVAGTLVVFVLAIVHAFVFYPTEILNAAAGYVYGFWVALPLMMVGWIANGMICFWLGRNAARPALYRLVGRDRFVRAEALVTRGGVTLLLAVRLLPIVPFSLISYVAGAARVPTGRYLWTTAVGYLPITAAFIYLGTRLDGLTVTDPAVLIAVAAVIVLLLVGRRIGRAAERRPSATKAAEHAP